MKSGRHLSWIRATAALTLSAACWAQSPGSEPQTEPKSPDVPYAPPIQSEARDAGAGERAEAWWVRIRGEDVNLRSRPDGNSTVVAQLATGRVLRAVDREFGWLRVEPPREVFSLISSAHVEMRGEHRAAVSVKSGKLRVRVGSTERDGDPLRAEVQTLLADGTEVRIREREGDWLKIDPPAGVYVYVSEDYTEPISEADARQWLRDEAIAAGETDVRLAADVSSGATPDAAQKTGESEAAAATPAEAAPAAPLDLSGRQGEALTALEERIEAEGRKPVLEQEWEGIIAEMSAIAAQKDEPQVARLAAAWTVKLRERVADQGLIRQAREISRRQARNREQLEQELERIRRAQRELADDGPYDARGELAQSFAFDRERHPRRYRLVNPLSERIEVYLEFPEKMDSDPRKLLGRYVGVRGVKRHVAGLDVDLIEVREIVELKRPARSAATQPARVSP